MDDDGGANCGAVWILFLNRNGTVKTHQKISSTAGGFTGTLDPVDHLGISVATVGDMNGDGVTDLAAGAHMDDDGGSDRGALWLLFLNPDGTVKGHQKISDTEGGFEGILDNSDFFGRSSTVVGDLNDDGIGDLAVGAYFDDDGGSGRGAVYILFPRSVTTITFDGDAVYWTPMGSGSHDVIRGNLGVLRASEGDFSLATEICLSDDDPRIAFIDTDDLGVGEGFWYLVRESGPAGNETYDSCSESQVGMRDDEIAASGEDCL
jgi:hypothetical protein